jgi:hypothetical protein
MEFKLNKPKITHVDGEETSHSKQKQRGATNMHICDRSFKIGETGRKTSTGSSSGGYIDSRTRILTTQLTEQIFLEKIRLVLI